MYNDNIDNNNTIFVDTNTKSKTSIIYCVVCFEKTQLDCIDPENYKWKCPRCKNDYLLFGYGGDIVKEEDELISSHESTDEGPILFAASSEDSDSSSILDREKGKSDIKKPKYMKDSETTTVTYREY